MTESQTLPLDGVRVIDIATVIAGPGTTARLSDFGADVIKVEHPEQGDTARNLGWKAGDVSLLWKHVGRNKRPITLNLSTERGQELLRRLVETADVLVESFRPGTLERWNLAPDRLLAANPSLVILRTSGFGQTGPYAPRPGFGSLAESLSGMAHMTGFPDGPPVLPAVALADEVAGLLGAFGVMVALYHRDARGGAGQVIDLSLVESLFGLVGPIAAVYDTLGVVPGRIGNRIVYSAPRGAFRTRDGRWVTISGTSQSVAERILTAMGRADLFDDPRFATNQARLANVDELDAILEAWFAEHDLEEVLRLMEEHHAAAAPILDAAGIVADPHYVARGTLERHPDDELGSVLLAKPHPVLSATPGRVAHPGLPAGAANDEVYRKELGLTDDELDELRDGGVI
jgi:crotonobetainyl-CoA:carnitine CoA-transferase CaiB-like acyl-CoA transferase